MISETFYMTFVCFFTRLSALKRYSHLTRVVTLYEHITQLATLRYHDHDI